MCRAAVSASPTLTTPEPCVAKPCGATVDPADPTWILPTRTTTVSAKPRPDPPAARYPTDGCGRVLHRTSPRSGVGRE